MILEQKYNPEAERLFGEIAKILNKEDNMAMVVSTLENLLVIALFRQKLIDNMDIEQFIIYANLRLKQLKKELLSPEKLNKIELLDRAKRRRKKC